ncbi:hypothetical protein JAB6_01350 [Janthinobacterium sp. HH104]|uniref:hypothetical protein n=1 Tax=Janthinobacterium sp. HH104 TaxID=1537276 RepID=UPI00087445D5|nr:hypothetical protein [Janthinobacterium sp. HH104]OEZ88985.1 hypothetical protein JAB6_01350 [Janthinobacterium sp. HH104]
MYQKGNINPTAISPVNPWQIVVKIEDAFSKPPDVANVRHGQRRIHQGGRGRRTALFPSRKNGGAMPVESRLELAYALVLEATPSVYQYRTQAVEIITESGERSVPDFLIKSVRGNYLFHEVKPSKSHLKRNDLDRFSRIKTLLSEMDIEFLVIDAAGLPSESEVQELLRLYAQGHRQHYTAGQIDLAQSLLDQEIWHDLGGAREVLTANALPFELVSYLLFHNRLTLNTALSGGLYGK